MSASHHNLYPEPNQRQCTSDKVTVMLGELRPQLLKFINSSQIVVGCVAWITDPKILEALSRRHVALIVQKEKWWKENTSRGTRLAKYYSQLTGGLPAEAFPSPLSGAPAGIGLAPIACMGSVGGGNGFGGPLMHHKFIIRCRAVKGALVPEAVWTGSFNFSGNANNSMENVVVIRDPKIAAAYLHEFALVASLSEPMNWKTLKVKPGGLGKPLERRAPRKRSKTKTQNKSSSRTRTTTKAKPTKRTTRRTTRRRKAA